MDSSKVTSTLRVRKHRKRKRLEKKFEIKMQYADTSSSSSSEDEFTLNNVNPGKKNSLVTPGMVLTL